MNSRRYKNVLIINTKVEMIGDTCSKERKNILLDVISNIESRNKEKKIDKSMLWIGCKSLSEH